MQGLILAAGMGKRLGRHTQENTKCMVEISGKRLIEHVMDSFDALRANGIELSRVVIVTGYKGENLKKFLGDDYRGIRIEYIDNPIYDKTNNIYSLWLAGEVLAADDTLLLESDLIFEKSILTNLARDVRPNLAVVDKFDPMMDGTVTLLDEQDNITHFVPKKEFDWNTAHAYYKTVNIYKFSKEFSRTFYLPFLDAYSKAFGNNEYYEQVLRVLIFLQGTDLKAYKLNREELWYEIDDVIDLNIAGSIFSHGADKLQRFQQRYGGYWRFPQLIDFCYLVNPYFPTTQLKNELKYSFDALLTQYPSGLSVQNLLASRMFMLDPGSILVGNGAAELIKACVESLPGNFGIIYPTFNEYPEKIGADRVKSFIPENDDFSYTAEDLLQFMQQEQVATLVLINPDNPSGHFLPQNEVSRLLKGAEKLGKRVIVDESFVDFAEERDWFTMLEDELLEAHSNMIVIKSISKSYGVPGLRLGVLAASDKALLKQIRGNMSIWNINSFGEFFLQVINKHLKDYQKACKYIRADRAAFFAELQRIPFLRPIPSSANYFLCELLHGYDSTQLTEQLLEEFGLFIKDLKGKKGIGDRNYIRLAVRDHRDNSRLIEVLQQL